MSIITTPGPESTPLLSIRHVSKRYGTVIALDDVSIDIARGEFFALLGPSGCGKTTLMRSVAGFEAPDSGQLLLDGEDLSGMPPYRRPVNMMFQSYALFPHLDVFENVAFGLRRQGQSNDVIATRVAELLELTQLGPYGERKINELSGGQRQRVALARALAPGPRLLLLDEPLGALDRKLREETQFHLKKIQRETGTSFMIVTHDQDEALALADRIAVMRAGRIEQVAGPNDIYERPASRFVAGFVGDTNFIDGVIVVDDGPWLETIFGRITLSPCALPAGARATLSVRPEDIVARREGPGIAGIIEEFVFRGDNTLLRVSVANGVTLRVATWDMRFSAGESVSLQFPRETPALFAETT
jgi:putrescine transport system ATP-binding protein